MMKVESSGFKSTVASVGLEGLDGLVTCLAALSSL